MRKSIKVQVAEIDQRARSNTHRLEELENKVEALDNRQDSTEKTVIEIKKDTEKILELSKESKDRWKEFDKSQHDVLKATKKEIIKWILRVAAGIIIVALGLKKYIL